MQLAALAWRRRNEYSANDGGEAEKLNENGGVAQKNLAWRRRRWRRESSAVESVAG